MQRTSRAVTLLELLVAIILLSIVVLALSNIQIFSRYHVITADRRAKLQNEVSFALEHMSKHIGQVIGHVNAPAVKTYNDNRGIRFRVDTNNNAMVDDTDRWEAYYQPAVSNEIRFYDNVGNVDTLPPVNGGEVIATHVLSDGNGLIFQKFQVVSPNTVATTVAIGANAFLNDNILDVKITSRWDPKKDASQDNAEVSMDAKINMSSVSTH